MALLELGYLGFAIYRYVMSGTVVGSDFPFFWVAAHFESGQDLQRAYRHGVFNLKTPSCYVFPTEDDGAPGDQFRLDQSKAMEGFAAYRTFHFAMAWYQIAATWTSIADLCAALAALLAWLVVANRDRDGHDERGGRLMVPPRRHA